MLCTGGTCTASRSSSILSSDSSTIHSFFIFGSTQYLYYASFASATGSVGSLRYKSSVIWYFTGESALSGDYIVIPFACGSALYGLVILNTATNVFTMRKFGIPGPLYVCREDLNGR